VRCALVRRRLKLTVGLSSRTGHDDAELEPLREDPVALAQQLPGPDLHRDDGHVSCTCFRCSLKFATDANNAINEVLSKLTALGTVLVPMNLITGLWVRSTGYKMFVLILGRA
jgi:hypothetical protein